MALLSTSSQLDAQVVAWARVQPAGQGLVFTPSTAYQFSTAGQNITVARGGVNNEFVVTIPAAAPSIGGCVHASAVDGNHTAVVESWLTSTGDVQARIALYDSVGGPANDAKFNVHWRHEGPGLRREAYVWADSSTASSYTPTTDYSWNGNRPDPTITRSGTGQYQVTFPGLAAQGSDFGSVQVTPFGLSPLRAKVHTWGHSNGDVIVNVRCYDISGALTDGRFTCSYQEVAAPIHADDGSGAHVYASEPTAVFYRPSSSYTDSNGREGPPGEEMVERVSLGRYRVNLPNMAPIASATVQVTAAGPGAGYATIDSWTTDGCGGTDVNVTTFDGTGGPADQRFTLLYLSNRPAATPIYAWAAIEPLGQGSTFTPDLARQFSTAGQQLTVNRGAASNAFTVLVPDGAPSVGGIPHLTAMNGNHTAVVKSWLKIGDSVHVSALLFDAFGNPAGDRDFTMLWRYRGNPDARQGYCWANDATAASYTPLAAYSWNGDRGAPTVTRLSTGTYRVDFPNLGGTGPERGSVQITPYGSSMLRAKVTSWQGSTGDLQINVRCTDHLGTPTDGRFIVSYNELAAPIAAEHGSGAHVWANLPTAASYTPNSYYTHSNGRFGPQDSETIDRLSVGRYQVNLPDVDPSGSVTLKVSGQSSDSTYASIESWSGGRGGIEAIVQVWSAGGTPADGRFTLLALTDTPAFDLASNVASGSGCNGPVLSGLTRPILCRDWSLALGGVSPSAVLGFVQLSFVSQNLLLGPNAPGCVAYTDGAVSILLLPPLPEVVYSLSLPSDPSFLGLQIHAQGGAFIPGINAYDLAASNRLTGTIGDY
ncbi:MAG: hypothetical protein NXI31_03340 [bacterium]|nr:hypothetical protein [bacterium]